MRLRFLIALLLFWTVAGVGTAFAGTRGNLDTARTAFQHGRADEALRALDGAIHEKSNDAAAWNLQCRVYLAQGRADDAVAFLPARRAACSFEQHVPPVAGARLRSKKPANAGMMTAYKTAKLVHAEFETAVSLDGNNREALSDLGQYYVEAPKILGGGCDKAENLAQRLSTH